MKVALYETLPVHGADSGIGLRLVSITNDRLGAGAWPLGAEADGFGRLLSRGRGHDRFVRRG
jgi:hypothetical protein